MILKMSAVTSLYVGLTVLLWHIYKNKKIEMKDQLLIGVIYGLCSVLSTHYGIDYGDMLLNVRDIGPLAAGLFFHPVSGVISGLIGGIERYIAGTYMGVGSYTRIACSVSTCLAGFLTVPLNKFIFRGRKPSPIYAFFMGAVMEVFHMYVVFITHRDDMRMAFYVVKICAPPMIIFTGIGMAVSSYFLMVHSGQWKMPSRHLKGEEVPVSHRFQFWLFVVTTTVFALNFGINFAIQTQSAFQNAQISLANRASDMKKTINRVESMQANLDEYAQELALAYTEGIAQMIEDEEEDHELTPEFLEELRNIYGMDAIYVLDGNSQAICQAGTRWRERSTTENPDGQVSQSENAENVGERTELLSNSKVVAYIPFKEGYIQTVMDENNLLAGLDLSGFRDIFSAVHINTTDVYDILSAEGRVIVGVHSGRIFNSQELDLISSNLGEKSFNANLFGKDYLCRSEKLANGMILLTALANDEIYADRDAQAYESTFANILVFTVIYILITFLVQQLVVNNLTLINESLSKITDGDLNEVVSVRDSSEFASLSDDINQTVDALKGYIEAAEKRIEQELLFARTIQDAALPKNFTFPREEFQLYASMNPAKKVGGDFYDFFFVDMDKIALVIADVSGKGIPAALFMMRAKTAIRSLAESGSNPEEIFFKANNTLCDGNDAEMFVTAWIGILDLKTGMMTCANAGHEYPVIMRAGQNYELYKDKHTMPLATLENIRAKEYELKLNPGDKLFVYTDGIPEAINKKTEDYGTDRLLSKLNTLKDASPVETLLAVRQDISIFAGDEEQFDDITMLGFEYYGSQPKDDLS